MSVNDLWQYEREYADQGFKCICGVDEAGRGPLAGHVFAAAVILPYCLATVEVGDVSFDKKSVIMLLIVSIIHTGIAYTAYFGSMKNLQSQTIAIMSYIDPIVAVVLSALLLKEKMSALSIVGAVMILSATFLSEVSLKKKSK